MSDSPLHSFIRGIPKAELHVHLGGTLEPEQMFEFARRNDRPLGYDSVDELKAAYHFNNLQEFLDLFHKGTSVLMKEQDYFDLTWSYMQKVRSENVLHAEIFFDAQTHTERGIAFGTVICGIHRALEHSRRELGMTSRLIPSFLRHLGEKKAFHTFQESLEFREMIDGFGLASSEMGHPPSEYRRVFDLVRQEGFNVVAHAGEEGPAEYVREAVELLKVKRIDHGNRCLEDESLVALLVKEQIPLTLCPLSNLALKVIRDMREHPLRRMMELGMMVTVNSDDPAYFGGYINDNYIAAAEALGLTKNDIITLAKNSFRASFLPEKTKSELVANVDEYANNT